MRKKHRSRPEIRYIRLFTFLVITGFVLCAGIRVVEYLVQTNRTRTDMRELESIIIGADTVRHVQPGRETVVIENADEVLPAVPEHENVIAEPVSAEKSIYRTASGILQESMRELYAKNGDLIAWLRIPDVCNCPVVYRDNEYYLDHDFYGRKNVNGTLFIDELTPLREDVPVLLIHGHNMHNGEMFGTLTHYAKKSFAAENPYLSLKTLYDTEYYVLAGAMLCDIDASGSPDYYSRAVYSPALGWDFEYFRELWDTCAEYATEAGMEESDALLTLSTCTKGSERLLVLFRRVRDGETPETFAHPAFRN